MKNNIEIKSILLTEHVKAAITHEISIITVCQIYILELNDLGPM